jgi:hypothetical protein
MTLTENLGSVRGWTKNKFNQEKTWTSAAVNEFPRNFAASRISAPHSKTGPSEVDEALPEPSLPTTFSSPFPKA